MTTRTDPWPPGTPNWVDLATTDREGAFTFYSDVLGWTVRDTGETFGHYGMAEVDGQPTAGIAAKQDHDPMPARWTTYLATDDADATAEAIKAHGGTVVAGPFDVGEEGRMALALDPTGAEFGIWQSRNHIGFRHVNEPGGVVWNMLATGDLAAAKEFYAAVFGYTYSDAGEMVTIDGEGPGGTVGGMGGLEEGNPDAQTAWSVTFSVADADTTAQRAIEGGGTVVFGPVDTDWGRMATIRDPQGVHFGVISASAP